MKKKKVKRLIASVLAVAMCFTMTTALSFASVGKASSEQVNLVTFGDSTSNGFGMPDYLREAQGFSTNNNYLDGWKTQPDWTDETAWTREAALDWNAANPDKKLGRMSNSAYPWLLKKYIQDEQGVKTVNLTPFNLNGIRTDELRAYLDEDFYKKRSASEYAYGKKWYEEKYGTLDGYDPKAYKGFFNAHVDDFTKSFYSSGAIQHNDLKEASDYVQKSIKEADVIVLDVCGNNFGTSLAFRLSSVTGSDQFKIYIPNAFETLDDVDGLPEGLKKELNALLDKICSVKAIKENPLAQSLMKAVVFCMADCFVNYSADMEWIMKNKKDSAKVITVGVTNQMTGRIIETNGKEIDLGDYASKIYGAVNNYMRAFDKNAKNSYFADPPEVLTSFYSLIHDADSLEELLDNGENNDNEYVDGRGHYAIELAADLFMEDFMKLTPDEMAEVTPEERAAIRQMLYTGIHDHSKSFTKVMLSGNVDAAKVKSQAMQYLKDIMDGNEDKAQMDEDSWGAIIMQLREVHEATMIHPSAVGCEEKYQAVLEAYLSDKTAYTVSVQDLLLQLNSLAQKMKKAITSSDFQKIIDKLVPIKEKLLEMRAAVLTDLDVKAALRKCVEMIRQARDEKKQAPEKQPAEEQNEKKDPKPANNDNNNSNVSKKSETAKVTLAKGKITSLKKGKKSFIVKWKKVAKADGYQISYKTGKKAKMAKVKGANKLSKKVAKLKAKKKYTVKVRAYKIAAGKVFYGKWSKAKKVTTK